MKPKMAPLLEMPSDSPALASPKPITDSLNRLVRESLDAVPEGHRGAIVAAVDHDGTARAVVAGRINDQWAIVGVYEREASGAHRGMAAVQFTW